MTIVPLKVDAAYISLVGTICAAAVAAMAAVFLHFLSVRRTLRDRKRETCAQAITDALAWLELPYRIRRRSDDTSVTIAGLVNRMHDLQERLLLHESWLRVELPEAHASYCALVRAAKDAVRDTLRGAWGSPPAARPTDQNLDDLAIPSVDCEVLSFATQVRRFL